MDLANLTITAVCTFKYDLRDSKAKGCLCPACVAPLSGREGFGRRGRTSFTHDRGGVGGETRFTLGDSYDVITPYRRPDPPEGRVGVLGYLCVGRSRFRCSGMRGDIHECASIYYIVYNVGFLVKSKERIVLH